MITDLTVQLSLRTLLSTMQVLTSGSISVSALATGGSGGKACFSRAAGSWITDGFAIGMEVQSSLFTKPENNGYFPIIDVTATKLTVEGSLISEVAGSRLLKVVLPSARVLENTEASSSASGTAVEITVAPGQLYFVEQFVPGVAELKGCSMDSVVEKNALYILRFYFPEGCSITTPRKYADTLVSSPNALFKPGRVLYLQGQDVARVFWDPGPQAGQLMPDRPGWSVLQVTIPVWIQTTNS